jgi:hypothetical protein
MGTRGYGHSPGLLGAGGRTWPRRATPRRRRNRRRSRRRCHHHRRHRHRHHHRHHHRCLRRLIESELLAHVRVSQRQFPYRGSLASLSPSLPLAPSLSLSLSLSLSIPLSLSLCMCVRVREKRCGKPTVLLESRRKRSIGRSCEPVATAGIALRKLQGGWGERDGGHANGSTKDGGERTWMARREKLLVGRGWGWT